MHFALEPSIDDILANGVQARTGESSIGNDLRFYTFTLARGTAEHPAPTKAQLDEMVGVIVAQLQLRRRASEPIAIVHIQLPLESVVDLEQRRELIYGPFFPHAARGYTESVFQIGSFAKINQHRAMWRKQVLQNL